MFQSTGQSLADASSSSDVRRVPVIDQEVGDIPESPSSTAPREQLENARPPERRAVDRDQEMFGKAKPSSMEYLLHAMSTSGRSPLALAYEFVKLSRGGGRLTLGEYVQFGVYKPNLSSEERQRFITNTLHWPITHQCCDMTWQAATEDKWLCSYILERASIPVPPTLAVIDRSDRVYPCVRKITSALELRDFALANKVEPFFGKENRGICSFGAFLVTKVEPDQLHLKGEGWIGYDRFMDSFVGSTSYLLQPCQRNHPFFHRYTENLATVRMCLLVTDRGVKVPFSVLKLPARENIADSFWRDGNLACDVDPETGRILTARTKDALGTEDHTVHPQSGSLLVGETVPDWDRLLELVYRCAKVFAPVRYQSMDIAVTEAGPVVIEVNTGGGFDLPQLASGRGFLTDDVREFFRANGVKRI